MRDGSRDRAFEAFVAETGDDLFRIAVLLTSDRRLAEDVYQETLQRLARHWGRVDNPKAFARTVLHNLVVDRVRQRARRPQEIGLSAAADRADPGGDEGHVAVELRPTLLAALDTLTPLQRAVVVMRYFDDRSEADIATLVGVSAGTVKSTASRAIALLRAQPDLVALFATTETRP